MIPSLVIRLVILLLTVCGDAATEGMIERIHYGSLIYHIFRYGTMYTLWGYISYDVVTDLWQYHNRIIYLIMFGIFAILCRYIWRAIYKHFDI